MHKSLVDKYEDDDCDIAFPTTLNQNLFPALDDNLGIAPQLDLSESSRTDSRSKSSSAMIPDGVIHCLDGKLYMDVDFIVRDPTFAVSLAKQQREVTRQNRPSQQNKAVSKEFHWTQELCRLFAIGCTAIGIKNVTPKQLQVIMPFSMTREVVGSHLQKYRIKLQKQYGLESTHCIQNYHIPKDIVDDTLTYFQQLWEKGVFTGYSVEKARELVVQQQRCSQ